MNPEGKKFFYLTAAVVLFITAAHLILIMILNDGKFTYALDDPYIHLSMAENIAQGHFGINQSEPSSPSSSILFPFLLAGFSLFLDSKFILLIFNIIFALCFVFVLVKILNLVFLEISKRYFTLKILILFLVFLPASNLLGLIFTGMEHVLQILLVVLIFYELLKSFHSARFSWLIVIPLVILPLVRYEGLAVSVPVIIYLFYLKEWKKSITSLFLIAVLLGTYSIFLMNLGLQPFPSSILVKSSDIAGSSVFTTLFANFKRNLREPFLVLLAVQMAIFISFSILTKRSGKYKFFALVVASSILLHLIFGSSVWFYRYEIYIWIFSIVSLVFLFSKTIERIAIEITPSKIFIVLFIFSTIIFYRNYHITLAIPFASNNIYLQQFQMRKFVAEYYKQPVAANDIGYVSYKNDIYILDLWGLSNIKAFERRFNADGLDKITKDYKINLVMIFKEEFEEIPRNWIEVGYLELERDRVSTAHSVVNFFVTDQYYLNKIKSDLTNWEKSLPKGVRFNFQ